MVDGQDGDEAAIRLVEASSSTQFVHSPTLKRPLPFQVQWVWSHLVASTFTLFTTTTPTSSLQRHWHWSEHHECNCMINKTIYHFWCIPTVWCHFWNNSCFLTVFSLLYSYDNTELKLDKFNSKQLMFQMWHHCCKTWKCELCVNLLHTHTSDPLVFPSILPNYAKIWWQSPLHFFFFFFLLILELNWLWQAANYGRHFADSTKIDYDSTSLCHRLSGEVISKQSIVKGHFPSDRIPPLLWEWILGLMCNPTGRGRLQRSR